MPNRILRDTALDSDRIAGIDEGSEVLFYRLIMLADDFGRFDGRVSVIRGRAFALRQTVTEREIERRLAQLSKSQLIHRYKVADKPYISIPRFGQRQRAEKSKFPPPDSGTPADDGQLTVEGPTSAHVVVVGDVYEGDSKAAQQAARPTINGQVIETLPLRGGGVFEVTSNFVAELDPVFSAVDVPATLKEMKGWCLGNPDRLKSRKGIKRFITNWLRSEQEKHGSKA